LNSIHSRCVRSPDQRPVRDRPVRPRAEEIVLEAGLGDPHVAVGVLVPLVAEVDAVLADDWETGIVSDVEACCADDDVFGEVGVEVKWTAMLGF
jgi:hypothetical protein